jgi:hypothetical protein
MYFKGFPKITYDPIGNGNTQLVTDILTRVAVRKSVRERRALFSEYDVFEYESPETVAFELYGKAHYHWVVMMFNKYYDRYYEWPLTTRNLEKFVSDKYSDANGIHHYETSQSSGDNTIKIKVELADVPTATPITNYEYEQNLNDIRRRIKVLAPGYLPTFLKEFKSLLKIQV